jgi:hypothetical protein
MFIDITDQVLIEQEKRRLEYASDHRSFAVRERG